MRLAGIAVLLAACGGGAGAPDAAVIDAAVVPDAIPPIVCRGTSDSDLVSVTPVTAVPFSAGVGERLAAPLTVRVHTAEDVGIAGCTIAWGAGAHNGWLFPLTPVTGDDGVASAWWIPGTDPSEIATAMIWVPDAWATADLTATIAPTATRASAITATFEGDADAVQLDIRPHVGADARIVLSWVGTEASLVDVGGVRSVRLTGPNAAPIEMPFAWQDDHTHTIQLESTVSNDVVLLIDSTVIGSQHLDSWTPGPLTASLVDDAVPAASCLDAALRTVTLSNVVPTPRPAATAADLATTPDALACGNVTARVEDGALVLTTGGSDVGDPAVTHLAL